MAPLVLVSVVLLVYCTGVCASQESDTTASQLMEGQLNEAELCTCEAKNCSSLHEDLVDKIEKRVTAAFKKTVEDLLSQFSHFVTPGSICSHPACSCQEILQLAPQSPSGFYWISGTDNKPKYMYCDMERSCKGVAGGWMRLASINMTDTSSTCPPGLRTLTSPRRLCAMNMYTGRPGCSSVVFPVQGVEYSQVCGKIIGYQQGTPDAFHGGTIDSWYVDGFSLTHGQNPRTHIWTFTGALHEHYSHLTGICPCINASITPPPPVPHFVGDDYFCDTASRDFHQFIFYPDDPLWDGAGCGPINTCCSWNSPPWFRKEISPPTSDDIEMRLCANEDRFNEDINFETLEIYVQ